MRLTVPRGAQGAWLTVGRSAAGAVLVTVAVSACTASGASPSTFTPTPQTGGAGSQASAPGGHSSSPGDTSPAASATSSGGVSASGSPHASASASPGVTTILPSPTRSSAPAYPTAAPETGGGGTAGLQDASVFGIGGIAVLAGFGSLAYRRRLARKFRTDDAGDAGDAAPRNPADRDPANR